MLNVSKNTKPLLKHRIIFASLCVDPLLAESPGGNGIFIAAQLEFDMLRDIIALQINVLTRPNNTELIQDLDGMQASVE